MERNGFFDGEEREFRGFGLVEQWDTEEIGALRSDGALPPPVNIDESSYFPPVFTQTCFHTDAFSERPLMTRQFERYTEADDGGRVLMPDTVVPTTRLRDDGSAARWALATTEVAKRAGR